MSSAMLPCIRPRSTVYAPHCSLFCLASSSRPSLSLNSRQLATQRKKRSDPRHDPFAVTSSRVFVSRQVAKLQQMDNRFGLVNFKKRVIDLGSAPGSWSQYIWGRFWTKTKQPKKEGTEPKLISVDKELLAPRIRLTPNYDPHLQFIQGDFQDPTVQREIQDKLQGHKADLIVSDLLANPDNLTSQDRLLSLQLLRAVLEFAAHHLRPKGDLVVKFYYDERAVDWAEKHLKPRFAAVHRHISSSRRPEPRESFFVCKGFKGMDDNTDGQSDTAADSVEQAEETRTTLS